MVQAVIDRPNITGYITYHTFSGVHLRPYSGHPDDDFPTADLRAYKYIGERATKITGYPAKSVFHDFKYEPKQVIRGGSDDWMYDHVGVYAWTTEFWSPQQQIGLKDYHLIEWMRDHPIEDDLKLLKWNDEVLQPQRLRRLVSVRASAVGAGGVGRLGLHVLLEQSACRISGERDRAAQRLCDLPLADLAEDGSRIRST